MGAASLTPRSWHQSAQCIYRLAAPEFKEKLSQVLVEKLNPISLEIKRLTDDKSFLDKILLEGQKKANYIASKKLKKMQEIVGF